MRPEMVELAKTMEHKLQKNDHKREWGTYGAGDVWWLLAKLREEVDELEEALHLCAKGELPAEEVLFECGDVSNFNLMIHSVVLRHGKVETP